MSFDRAYYKTLLKFIRSCLNHSPTYVMSFYNMIPELLINEDYEAVHAIKIGLMDWFNENNNEGLEVTKDTLMKIPDYA